MECFDHLILRHILDFAEYEEIVMMSLTCHVMYAFVNDYWSHRLQFEFNHTSDRSRSAYVHLLTLHERCTYGSEQFVDMVRCINSAVNQRHRNLVKYYVVRFVDTKKIRHKSSYVVYQWESIVESLARGGHFDLIELVNLPIIDRAMAKGAAAGGYEEVVMRYVKNKDVNVYVLVELAAQYGHQSLVEKMTKHLRPWNYGDNYNAIVKGAIQGNQKSLLMYFLSRLEHEAPDVTTMNDCVDWERINLFVSNSDILINALKMAVDQDRNAIVSELLNVFQRGYPEHSLRAYFAVAISNNNAIIVKLIWDHIAPYMFKTTTLFAGFPLFYHQLTRGLNELGISRIVISIINSIGQVDERMVRLLLMLTQGKLKSHELDILMLNCLYRETQTCLNALSEVYPELPCVKLTSERTQQLCRLLHDEVDDGMIERFSLRSWLNGVNFW